MRHWQVGLVFAFALLFGVSGSIADDIAEPSAADRTIEVDSATNPCEAFHYASMLGDTLQDPTLVDELRERCRLSGQSDRRIAVRGGSWIVEEIDGERLTAINDFFLDRHEVTIAEFRQCIRDGVCEHGRFVDFASNPDCNLGAPSRESHPMNCVDWFAASAYCGWAGGRLPTESELEWVSSDRGRFRFPWGWPMVTCERANHRRDRADGCGTGTTWAVGSHPEGASPLGIGDLIGNLAEWVADGYQEHLPAGRYIDPVFEGDSSRHAARGGSWRDPTSVMGSHLRAAFWASDREPEVGFRCAADNPGNGGRRALVEPPDPTADAVLVSRGVFLRGSSRRVGDIDESPQRHVSLPAYRLSRDEITVARYRDCVIEGGCTTLDFRRHDDDTSECNYGAVGRDLHPMNCVSWAGAQEYCHWAGGRLPTEAEWEYAARGIDSRIYPWGNEPADCSLAGFNPDGRLPSAGCGYGGTVAVGLFVAGVSAFQVLDMAGNVQEWVSDWYDSNYYVRASDTSPMGPLTGSSRVVRGGSYADSAVDLRSANRSFLAPESMPSVVGFRCVWPLEESSAPSAPAIAP